MGEVYDRIAAFDRGIADRWKARTREKPDYKLRAKDIDAIVGPMMRTQREITEKQANAIVAVVKGTKFDRADVGPIRARLRYYVKVALGRSGFERVPLLENDLLPIHAALSSAGVLKINFKSPKTAITYAPIDYLSVRRLIEAKEIICAEIRIGEMSALTHRQGEYNSDFNALTLFNGQTPIDREVTIVHETTHIIQDFRDAKGIATHFETDAFIAESVVRRTLNGKPRNDIEDAALKAADIVLAGGAGLADKVWLDAYDAVLKAVNASSIYKATSRLMVDNGKGEKRSELNMLKAAAAVEQESQAFRDWVGEVFDEMLVKPFKEAAHLLPGRTTR